MTNPGILRGDSMPKVREKRSSSKSGLFFDETCKIIMQFDDLGHFFNNFCNFGVFLAQNEKYTKITFFLSKN